MREGKIHLAKSKNKIGIDFEVEVVRHDRNQFKISEMT